MRDGLAVTRKVLKINWHCLQHAFVVLLDIGLLCALPHYRAVSAVRADAKRAV